MTTYNWSIDAAHSGIYFSIRHMVVSKVRGRFAKYAGTIHLDESDLTRSDVVVMIDAASLDTGVPDRDAHLRAPDFFDVEKFPEIEFRSTSIRRGKDRDALDLEGELRIKDKTVPIALAVNEMDRSRSPRGEDFVYYSATTELDRYAFGINYGRGFIGRRLRVHINVQASSTYRQGDDL